MNIFVAGANKGLGFCLVELFASKGHRVVAGAYPGADHESLDRLEDEVLVYPLDIGDEHSVKEAAEKAAAYFNGFIDIVVNTAGVLLPVDIDKTILEIPTDIVNKTMLINATGNIFLAKYFLPLLRADGEGKLYLITSEAGSMTHTGSNFPIYSISKTAANKIAFVLKATYGEKYEILAIHPGRMKTDMGGEHSEITPEESAAGIYAIAAGEKAYSRESNIFINYKGEAMEV